MPAILPILGKALKFGIPALMGAGAYSILTAEPKEQKPPLAAIPMKSGLDYTELLKGLMKEISSIIKETQMSPKDLKYFMNTALAVITPLHRDIFSPLSMLKTTSRAEADLATALQKQGQAMMLQGNDVIARMLFGSQNSPFGIPLGE